MTSSQTYYDTSLNYIIILKVLIYLFMHDLYDLTNLQHASPEVSVSFSFTTIRIALTDMVSKLMFKPFQMP